MDKKVIIGIVGGVILLLVILLAVFLIFMPSEQTITIDDMSVTVPGNYTVIDEDGDDGVLLSSGDTSVALLSMGSSGSSSNVEKFYGALRDNGKDSGYENVTTKDVNGLKIYEYAAHPSKLQNVSTTKQVEGNYETWTEYTPEMGMMGANSTCDHFRTLIVDYSGDIYVLAFSTDVPGVSLYTQEIENMINSLTAATSS